MKQDHFVFNIARGYNKGKPDMSGTTQWNHYCKIEKACVDLVAPGSVNEFVAELRRAFSAIGEFKITVTRWTYRGETLDI